MASRTNKQGIAKKKAQQAKQASRVRGSRRFDYPKRKLELEEAKELTASIKADKDTKMKTIGEVKQALREAKVYNVTFTATQSKDKR